MAFGQRKNNSDLMELSKLKYISQDLLQELLNDDAIEDHTKFKQTVIQAFEKVFHGLKESRSTDGGSSLVSVTSSKDQQCDDLIPVVVYLQTSFRAILAYELDTRKTYSLPHNGLPKDASIIKVYFYKNHLYILITQSDCGKHVRCIFRFNPIGQWESLTEVPEGSYSFMFTDSYIYCIMQYKVYRLNMKYRDNSVWFCVYNLPEKATCNGIFGEKLFISQKKRKKQDEDGQKTSKYVSYLHITCMDTVTLTSSVAKYCFKKNYKNITQIKPFYCPTVAHPNLTEDNMYLLMDQDLLLRVTSKSGNSLKFTKEESISTNEMPLPLIDVEGAVRHGKVLFLFVRQVPGLSYPTALTSKSFDSFDEVKIVPLAKTDSCCVPITIPKVLLKIEA